jgi:VIT1/CCC1 family predicted Fe2+/Mn2+ transporter
VSSQADTESADLDREKAELQDQPAFERQELAEIYVGRGLERDLAFKVADQLMAKDALGAHARDELGISDVSAARPLQAACTSAATFSVGAVMPLAVVAIATPSRLVAAVIAVSLLCLAVLGALGAKAGGASMMRSVIRITFWGALAMAFTAGIGRLFEVVV